MATTRKVSGSSAENPIKMESQEDSSLGRNYMVAKARLTGILKQLMEERDSANSSSHAEDYSQHVLKRRKPKVTEFRHMSVEQKVSANTSSHAKDYCQCVRKRRKPKRTEFRHMSVMEQRVSANSSSHAKNYSQRVLKRRKPKKTEFRHMSVMEQRVSANSSSHAKNYSHRVLDHRKPKRTEFRHMPVMDLFDRSVGLANFEEDTPLYPICRAWMANQPKPKHMSSNVYRLPRPKGAANPAVRIPSPTPQQKTVTNDINLNYEKNPPVAKEELMKDHLKRWVEIKRKWIKAAAVNEERYSQSETILQAMYNKAHKKH